MNSNQYNIMKERLEDLSMSDLCTVIRESIIVLGKRLMSESKFGYRMMIYGVLDTTWPVIEILDQTGISHSNQVADSKIFRI